MPKIAIIWDFDGTLTPDDSTNTTVEILRGQPGFGKEFWEFIKRATGKEFINPATGEKEKSEWEQLLGSDAPAWMYALSQIAFSKKIPLNYEFFKKFVVPHVKLYKNALNFLKELKKLQNRKDFKNLDLEIHHFIVSAGLKDLVEQVFPDKLITRCFGCRYEILAFRGYENEPESIPVFCMDETMKTRSLFEISKGSFEDPKKPVNKRVDSSELWAPFSNFIYIGDGPTDVPALSLTRYNGGCGVVVYNEEKSEKDIKSRLKEMSLDKRADFITPADFSLNGELFKYLEQRCIQIKQRYEAEAFV